MKKIILCAIAIICSYNLNAQQTVGLFTQNAGSAEGYVLFSPISSNNSYLIDKCGDLVHSWTGTHHPGQSVYLLQNGNLLRPGSTNNNVFTAGGNGGIVELFDWNSNLIWSYNLSSTTQCQHHDIRILPNGNVLAIVWELKTANEAVAVGRNPSLLGTTLWSEKIVELQPVGTNSANIVWEWHAWDHLIQDFDSTKANYGNVSQHPELININFTASTASDWLHCNALDYNPTLDQIILSAHNFSEVWIIDHSTSTTESSSHSGGVHSRGGDLMYRWGNSAAYNRGLTSNKKLFGQHNVRWIEDGMPNARSILVFNNGPGRPGGSYSTIDQFTPPIDSAGNYSIATNLPYLPDSAFWKYTAPTPTDFYSMNISGAQRLPNGNTIICEGTKGNFFEIDSTKTTVWKYVNPIGQNGAVSQGTMPAMNAVFRCSYYPLNYSGFNGQVLTPGNPIELNPLPYNCNMITSIAESPFSSTILIQAVNPFTTQIEIISTLNLLDVSLSLVDLTGRIIQQKKSVNLYAEKFYSFDLDRNLNSGIYLLRVAALNEIKTFKLIHQ